MLGGMDLRDVFTLPGVGITMKEFATSQRRQCSGESVDNKPAMSRGLTGHYEPGEIGRRDVSTTTAGPHDKGATQLNTMCWTPLLLQHGPACRHSNRQAGVFEVWHAG